ncbi:hypothetical protein IM697_30435 [Streptomyces ferrugineus]|uniref:Uncharacterized protein n=1 Tax=Streptomyces ferrugineus TaxID=1413221 RepID=A0A7M2SDM6_9ACTN|nr:hypothetical protein IM697_30435 [Streptomyces ferrugineus]
MFATVLDMDYSQAFDTITNEDTAVFDALLNADGNEAARLWRVKNERCVRYMIAQLPEDDADPQLWTTAASRMASRMARHVGQAVDEQAPDARGQAVVADEGVLPMSSRCELCAAA